MRARRRKLVGNSYSKIAAKRQAEIDAKEQVYSRIFIRVKPPLKTMDISYPTETVKWAQRTLR